MTKRREHKKTQQQRQSRYAGRAEHSKLAQYFTELPNALEWQTAECASGYEGKSDTQFAIIETKGEIILAFHGSNSDLDWKNNFNFPTTVYRSAKVRFYAHRGFVTAWRAIRHQFLELMETQWLPKGKPITIIGHSYGGAIAILCAEDFWFNFKSERDKLRLVTFGAPRVISWFRFNRVKHRWQTLDTTSYTNNLDIVTGLPPWLFGYRHVVRLTPAGVTRKNVKQWLSMIKNHDIREYSRLIEELENEASVF